jgi:hypothetical protein
MCGANSSAYGGLAKGSPKALARGSPKANSSYGETLPPMADIQHRDK